MRKKVKFKTNLKEERTKLYLSLSEVAWAVSVTPETIRKIENEECTPNVFLAIDLANYFDKPVYEMFWRV